MADTPEMRRMDHVHAAEFVDGKLRLKKKIGPRIEKVSNLATTLTPVEASKVVEGARGGGEGLKGLGAKALRYVGLPAATIGAGLAINAAYEKSRRSVGVDKAFAKVVKEYPDLVKQDPAYAQKVFKTLFRSSPNLAKDPLVAVQVLRTAIEKKKLGDDLEGMDPVTVKSLVDVDKEMRGTKAGPIQPKLF